MNETRTSWSNKGGFYNFLYSKLKSDKFHIVNLPCKCYICQWKTQNCWWNLHRYQTRQKKMNWSNLIKKRSDPNLIKLLIKSYTDMWRSNSTFDQMKYLILPFGSNLVILDSMTSNLITLYPLLVEITNFINFNQSFTFVKLCQVNLLI